MQHGVCNIVNDESVEQVKEMKYLGVMISDGCMDKKVEQRI